MMPDKPEVKESGSREENGIFPISPLMPPDCVEPESTDSADAPQSAP